MKEPDVKQQVDEARRQYKAGLITKVEYRLILDRISYHYDRWIKHNQ